MISRPLLFFIAAVLSIGQASAQKESEIVSRLRKALLQSSGDYEPPMILKGKITMESITMDGAIYFHKPRTRIEMEFSGIKFINVETDSVIWAYNGVDNTHEITKKTSVKKADDANKLQFDFSPKDLLNYKSRGFKLKSLGIKQTDSLETYELQLTKSDNSIYYYYISTKTYLLYKVTKDKEWHVYADYHRYGEYVFPSFLSGTSDGKIMTMIMPDVTIDATIPEELFTVPREAYEGVERSNQQLERMLIRGDSLYRLNEYTKAIDVFSQMLKEHGGSYRVYNGRGLAKLAKGEYYDAVTDFNSALKYTPAGSAALNNRGLAKYKIGDANSALEDYNAAIAADSLQVSAYSNRGRVYFDRQQYDKAAEEYGRAIQLQPEKAEYYYSYGVSLAQINNLDAALQSYRRAQTLGYEVAGFYNHFGVAHFRKSQYDTAVIMFKKAISLDEKELQYVVNLGNGLYALGFFKDASEQLEHYIAKKADNPEVFNVLGLCKYQEEDFKGAIRNFSKSIDLNPKNATYLNNRAAAKEQIEDYEGAIADYSQSIAVYPNDADVFLKRGLIKIQTSKKLEGCMDLGTANEMKHEGAKEAIFKHCN